jgi:hypothetical protein
MQRSLVSKQLEYADAQTQAAAELKASQDKAAEELRLAQLKAEEGLESVTE